MQFKAYLLHLLGAAVLAVGFVSCSDDPEPGPPPPPVPSDVTFKIFLNNVTFMSVDINVQPSDPTFSYYSHIVGKEAFARNWGSDVKVFMEDYIGYLSETEGLSKAEVVRELLVTGNDSWSYYDMDPSTEYVVFAVGLDANGTPNTEPEIKELTSASVDPLRMVECTFGLRVDNVTMTNATIRVTPSDKTLPYYYEVVPYETYQSVDDKDELFTAYVRSAMISVMQSNGVSVKEALDLVTFKGDGDTPLPDGALKPGKRYVVFAAGVDAYGRLNTASEVCEFESVAVVPSDNTFKLEVSNVTAVNAKAKVTTTNDDPYYAGFIAKKFYEGMTDQQLIEQLEKEGLISPAFEGNESFDAENMLLPGTDYELIAVGYTEAATTAIERTEFTTQKGGDPASCTFTASVEWDTFWGDFSIRPSDRTVFYYYEVMAAARYESDEKAIAAVEDMLANTQRDNGVPMERVLIELCSRGSEKKQFATESLTDYVLYAIPLGNDGKAAAPVFKQEFRSPERRTSDAVCEVKWTDYYNGAELYAYDPATWKWGVDYDQNPMCYVPATVTHNDAAVKWYAGSFGMDLMGHSDGAIVKNLIDYGGGSENTDKLDYEWTYFADVSYGGGSGGMVNTFVAVAIDANGDYGPIFRELFTPLTGECSPISDITGTQPAAAKVPARFRENPFVGSSAPGTRLAAPAANTSFAAPAVMKSEPVSGARTTAGRKAPRISDRRFGGGKAYPTL